MTAAMTNDIPLNTFHDKGPSLANLVATSTPWEAAIVPIGEYFRYALVVLTGFAIVTTGAVLAACNFYNPVVADKPDLFLLGWPWFLQLVGYAERVMPAYPVLAVLLICAAVLTEWFEVAGNRMQIALAVIAVITGLVLLPVVAAILIPLANLVAYVVFGIALAALFVGVIAVTFSGG
jgi:hypothetical protein